MHKYISIYVFVKSQKPRFLNLNGGSLCHPVTIDRLITQSLVCASIK